MLSASCLCAEKIPTDTLLMNFYQRAAALMGEGQEAQRSFDSGT